MAILINFDVHDHLQIRTKEKQINLFYLLINPYLMNGFSHHYHLGESTFIFGGVRSDFSFLSHFSMQFLCANRIAPDGTPHSKVYIFLFDLD